jgi:hypothetical protein
MARPSELAVAIIAVVVFTNLKTAWLLWGFCGFFYRE